MLRYEVENLDAVDPPLRDCYAQIEGGGFRLQISGYQTAAELREEKKRDTEARKVAEAKLRELELAQTDSTDADYRRAEAAAMLAKIPESLRAPAYRSAEYIAALAAYQAEYSAPFLAKVNEAAASMQSQIDSMRADRNQAMLEHAATSLAARIAHPGRLTVLLPHIAARLEGREADGVFSVHAKDASSLDDLAEQFRNDPAFELIIIGASPAEKARQAARVAETLGQPAARQPMTRALKSG